MLLNENARHTRFLWDIQIVGDEYNISNNSKIIMKK